MKIFGEFKKFIARGNVMDMAVGVIMGTAFTGIVNSLVNNILMKLIGVITGRVNIAELQWVVSPSLTIEYGAFLQAVLNFVLIAVSVFLLVKAINVAKDRLERKKEAEEAAEPEPKPSQEELLLTEIRDLLKKQTEQ